MAQKCLPKNIINIQVQIGGNIYFLEPYDSGKIPIHFVHGAAGSPQNWRYFINHINQEKYQACFYYYPSGAPIEAISYLLYWKLFNLQRKYHFKKMHIVAHSMGGLVVRSCLVNWGEQFPFINDFVSISTPWGGQNSAELGVEYSPVIIPAWKDLEPDGNFIKSLYQKKLPESVQSYLFFGYKGNRNPFSTNNDKVVSLASELDQRAQKDAEMVFGFNEDHMSILSSDQVMRQFNTIIDYNAENAMIQQLSGKLQIYFEFDSPDDLIKPRPRLLLRSTEYLNNEHIIYLRNKDSGKVLGPFPVGKYKVSLIADAFYPEPVSLLIDIKPDTVTTLSFKLNPRGSLLGRIINANEPQIQPFINRESNRNIKIKKITLSGNNIHRIIYPDKHDADQNKFDNYLSGTDCLIDACFYFYKLPAGVYTLTINAKGFKTFTAKYDVIPGQTYKTNTIELVPISEN
ncbi:MAG: alpha/beta hydrolase [Calditrichaceae bacterium]